MEGGGISASLKRMKKNCQKGSWNLKKQCKSLVFALSLFFKPALYPLWKHRVSDRTLSHTCLHGTPVIASLVSIFMLEFSFCPAASAGMLRSPRIIFSTPIILGLNTEQSYIWHPPRHAWPAVSAQIAFEPSRRRRVVLMHKFSKIAP